ncbi:MAG: hypothetical protein NVSMB39_0200 [Candidatus Saccharimonadales bacterium]
MLHEHRKLGILLQFGGHIEHDETPWRGLLRELKEEIGYEADQIKVLQPRGRFVDSLTADKAHPLPFYLNTHRFNDLLDHYHSDITYAVIAAEPPRLAMEEGESTAVHQFTLEQIDALAEGDLYSQTRACARHLLTSLKDEWEPVPAADFAA